MVDHQNKAFPKCEWYNALCHRSFPDRLSMDSEILLQKHISLCIRQYSG